MTPDFSQQNAKEPLWNPHTPCSLSPLGLIFALLLPDRLIGRTADFGSVSLGSSPSRATTMCCATVEWLFYLRTGQAEPIEDAARHKALQAAFASLGMPQPKVREPTGERPSTIQPPRTQFAFMPLRTGQVRPIIPRSPTLRDSSAGPHCSRASPRCDRPIAAGEWK